MKAAAASGLQRCSSCEQLWPIVDLPAGARASCGRGGATLNRRKPNSLARSWALLIAATVCYVPANVFPVMVVAGPGGSEADTILSGVQAMFAVGWWAVGALIFFASLTADWMLGVIAVIPMFLGFSSITTRMISLSVKPYAVGSMTLTVLPLL